jgi:ATP-dependent helicase/nuclease subunit B
MNIIFDTAFDGRIWPDWSSTNNGIIGSIRVGPLGLLDILETLLGLKGPVIPDSIRAAQIVPELSKNKDSFWVKSAQVDPFGVSKKLLEMRDYLWLHGWQDQPLTDRLAELAILSKQMAPGMPDRLALVALRLEEYNGKLPEIITFEPIETLAPLWRKVFDQISNKGGVIIEQEIELAQPEGDLAQACGENFTPVNDDSLQLIRPEGKLQAAEDIAAWLAAVNVEEGLDGTVIIGGDAVLDNALEQYGLPTLGAAASRYNHSLLELLPLVLAMGWDPPDPSRVIELLSLSASPVPKSIGNLLIRALNLWPAIGSPDWEENLLKGISNIADENQRQKVQNRLEILFHSDAKDGLYPVKAITDRIEMLATWLRVRFRDDSLAINALNQSQTLLAMIEAMKLTEISEPLLWKLLNEATININTKACPSQAGVGSVATPDGIIGEAKRVVWWSFSRSDAPGIDRTSFYEYERSALKEAGIILTDPGKQALIKSNRWRRPLLLTSRQLIFVCPKLDELGEELHPHPLWDELLAVSENNAEKLIAAVPKTDLQPTVTTPKLKPLPLPEIDWNVTPGVITHREYESPSSLDAFLGCPLKWVLNYIAKIRGGTTAKLPKLEKVLGSMAHEIMEEVLLLKPLPFPDEGARISEQLFNENGPILVAEIFQKGREVDKEKAKNTLIMATKSLLSYFHNAGCNKIEIEKELTGNIKKQKITGRADVVIDSPFIVLDLKRSWAKGFRDKLSKGTALQLAAYARMLKNIKGSYPELAYYILENQTFMTTDPLHFTHADVVDAPDTDMIWNAIEKSFDSTWAILEKGEIKCPGNSEEVQSRLEGDRLVLEPPCRFCDYDVLCGNRFVGGAI